MSCDCSSCWELSPSVATVPNLNQVPEHSSKCASKQIHFSTHTYHSRTDLKAHRLCNTLKRDPNFARPQDAELWREWGFPRRLVDVLKEALTQISPGSVIEPGLWR